MTADSHQASFESADHANFGLSDRGKVKEAGTPPLRTPTNCLRLPSEASHYTRRVASHHYAGWYGPRDDAAGPDDATRPDMDALQDEAVHADEHVVVDADRACSS